VKNVARMIREHKFVIDRVLAPLAPCLEATREKYFVTNIHGWVKFNLVGSEIRFADKNVGLVPPHSPGE
jgi:hypothetical protein